MFLTNSKACALKKNKNDEVMNIIIINRKSAF